MDIATEERCFLCGPYLDVTRGTISWSAVQGSEEYIGELARELQFSCFEPAVKIW
jgi:hypothetical protein